MDTSKVSGGASRPKARLGSNGYRLDTYINGQCEPGARFASADEAVRNWIAVAWQDPPADFPSEDWDASAALLSEAGVVVDCRQGRVVRLLAPRPAKPGESRLPLVVELNTTTGATRPHAVESAAA